MTTHIKNILYFFWHRLYFKALVQNKWLNILLKVVLVAIIAWAIYQQVIAKDDIGQLWNIFNQQLQAASSFWLLIVVVLLPFNLAVEVLKWRVVVKKITSIGFWQLMKCVLAGCTFSFWTPARIGDFGGRLLFVNTDKKLDIVLATWVSNLGQTVAIHLLGMFGLIYFLVNYLAPDLKPWMVYGTITMGVIYLGVYCLVYFNIDLLAPWIKRLPYLGRRLSKSLDVLASYDTNELMTVLHYAIVRLCIYSVQYYCFMRFFGIEIFFIEALILIFLLFSLQISLPIPPFMGFLLRGELALIIWGYFTDNQLGILASTFGLFTLNIIVPALIGLVLILNSNILKSIGYDKTTI